jgi:hypothetical protein
MNSSFIRFAGTDIARITIDEQKQKLPSLAAKYGMGIKTD